MRLYMGKQMNIKEKIKKIIIEEYNAKNISNPKKIDLEKPAQENEDPFFADFRNEIKIASQEYKEDFIKSKRQEDPEFIEQLEEVQEFDEKEEQAIDKKIMDMIEKKVLGILKHFNMGLYKYKKQDLKNIIITDMLENEINLDLSNTMKLKITEVIVNLVEHEFRVYESKKENRKKELLKKILKKILPDVNEFFEKNNNDKFQKMTLYQEKSILNFFLQSLEKKYLKVDRKNNKIDDDEYDFLKSKIKAYILRRHDQNKNL